MDRNTFYAYFEKAFFSSQSQDIIKSKNEMLDQLGDSDFIQNLLHTEGRLDMLAFLDAEYEKDQWESMVDFFVENGIIMLDFTGYYKYFGPNSLMELEEVYRHMIKDIYRAMQKKDCSLNELQAILESQSTRLSHFLISTSHHVEVQ